MKLACALIVSAALALGALAPTPERQGGPTGISPQREAAYRANNVGVARLEQFLYDEAAERFRRALELEPSLAMARLNLAIALYYGNRAEDAQGEARQAADAMSGAPQSPVGLQVSEPVTPGKSLVA